MCEKVKGSWTKGGAGLVMPDYAMTIQKSIVGGTKEESDFDKSCIPNGASNLPEHMSRQPSVQARDSCPIEIPRFARNDN